MPADEDHSPVAARVVALPIPVGTIVGSGETIALLEGVTADIAARTAEELGSLADPERARAMAAYMKTEMPFYGVGKPERKRVLRRLVEDFPPRSPDDYRTKVASLWELRHREEKYLAISYARRFADQIQLSSLDLYARMIVEGAWWDFVDEVAVHLVGRIVLDEREAMRPTLETWVDGPDMWLQRAALLSQLRHKSETDVEMLFDFCRRRSDEREFFIRKAIGWALREYSKTDPEAVRAFLAAHGEELSALSRREAARHL